MCVPQESAEGNNSGMTECVLSDNVIIAVSSVSILNYSLKEILQTHFQKFKITSENVSSSSILIPFVAYVM